MSRMIFAFCSLAFLSGCCHCSDVCHSFSLMTAKYEADSRNGILYKSHCRNQDTCIPQRPYSTGYESWWDDHVTVHTAQRCAFRGLREYSEQCGRPASHHFKMGFIAAYENVAMNRRPSPPVIPPPKYWNAYYRSCAGRPFVEDWFAGYNAGLDMANKLDMGQNCGVSQFHEVYLNRSACGMDVSSRLDYSKAALDDAVPPQVPQQPPLYPTPNMQSPNLPLPSVSSPNMPSPNMPPTSATPAVPDFQGNPYGTQGPYWSTVPAISN